jgi:hypothetical protein
MWNRKSNKNKRQLFIFGKWNHLMRGVLA